MSWFGRFHKFALSNDDALVGYRNRITLPMMIVAIVLLMPFPFISLMGDRYLVAGATGFVIVCFTWDAFRLYRGRPAAIPLALLLVPVAIAICNSSCGSARDRRATM